MHWRGPRSTRRVRRKRLPHDTPTVVAGFVLTTLDYSRPVAARFCLDNSDGIKNQNFEKIVLKQ